MIIDMRQKYEEPAVAAAFNVWVDIHAPIQMVFQYLTDAKALARWWCSRCEADPKPGGALRYTWEAEGAESLSGDAVYRIFEPPNLVVIEWTHYNGEPILCDGSDHRGMRWPALNRFELAMTGPHTTRVHLHDHGLSSEPRFAELQRATAGGWRETFTRLKRLVEAKQREAVARHMRKRDKQDKRGEK
jgi:uncharacterized protein YndB with AHSA1/START domain